MFCRLRKTESNNIVEIVTNKSDECNRVVLLCMCTKDEKYRIDSESARTGAVSKPPPAHFAIPFPYYLLLLTVGVALASFELSDSEPATDVTT